MPKPAPQRIVVRQQPLDLAVERRQVGEVHQADRAAADLVLIGRADAAPGGADAPLPDGGLAHRVEFLVQRQDQRDVLGDAQIVGRDRDALPLEPLDLLQQRTRIEHHAVADHRQLARPHHARRQQRQLVGVAVDDQRMAGIVAALEADHDVGLLGQPVDDLALAFVAPLGADHDHIGHEDPFEPHDAGARAKAAACAGTRVLRVDNGWRPSEASHWAV